MPGSARSVDDDGGVTCVVDASSAGRCWVRAGAGARWSTPTAAGAITGVIAVAFGVTAAGAGRIAMPCDVGAHGRHADAQGMGGSGSPVRSADGKKALICDIPPGYPRNAYV